MKVAIRADASTAIGTGHVMRCLTLADALRERGAAIRFVCRQAPGHLGNLIAEKGYEIAWLPERGNLAEDARVTHAAIADQAPWDWLIVDHYALDAAWERELRDLALKLMAIDDLADRSHDCDLLLDQNLQEAGRYAGLIPDACTMLIGPKYALLRPQFVEARKNLRVRDGRVSRLLVFFGGADAGGETLKALSAIRMLGRPDIAVDVVLGQTNPHRQEIEVACRDLSNVTLHCQAENMAELMAAADLFIGAGGTSSGERCCLGLPALVLATADNQITQSVALGHAGAHLYLGLASSVNMERLAQLIDEILQLPELLIHMEKCGQEIVDGRGTRRVADSLRPSWPIDLRDAKPADSSSLFAWRNHPDTRRHSLDSAEIAWDTHERWFTAVLADPNRELLIAEQSGQPVGVLRYDIEAGRAHISVYLVPGLAGQGLGARLLLAGEEWLRSHHPEVGILEAQIRPSNTASLGVFQSVGFAHDHTVLKKNIHDQH